MFTRLEVRNLDPDLIASCLVQEMMGHRSGSLLSGLGWSAHLVRGRPVGVGRFTVPVLYLDISGTRHEEIAAFLRRKTMRGGG